MTPTDPVDRPTALVTGATGAVGPVLVRALLAKGYRVKALCRRPDSDHELPADVERVCGDIADPAAVTAAPAP